MFLINQHGGYAPFLIQVFALKPSDISHTRILAANSFAQVMRENAQAVDAVLKERAENLHAMNAVEDLRSYEKLADAHADGLRKLVPAFEALYNSMSDDQKKTADAVFAKHEKRPRQASK